MDNTYIFYLFNIKSTTQSVKYPYISIYNRWIYIKIYWVFEFNNDLKIGFSTSETEFKNIFEDRCKMAPHDSGIKLIYWFSYDDGNTAKYFTQGKMLKF